MKKEFPEVTFKYITIMQITATSLLFAFLEIVNGLVAPVIAVMDYSTLRLALTSFLLPLQYTGCSLPRKLAQSTKQKENCTKIQDLHCISLV